MIIKNIQAIEIYDSRGWPTISVFLTLLNGEMVKANVPSGASTGIHEAHEKRDDDKARLMGKGVRMAVENINSIISQKLVGKDFSSPKEIDKLLINLDGTKNKSNLGANAILAVSLASMRAFALSENIPLWQAINKEYFSNIAPKFPRLMLNMINGGMHANWAFDFQEYLVIPTSNTPSLALEVGSSIFHSLEKKLKENNLSSLKGDEGGFSPNLNNNESPLELIIESASEVSYKNMLEFGLGLDIAASEFFENENYLLKKNNQSLKGNELMNLYNSMIEKFSIETIEDPFAEDDFNSWQEFNKHATRKNFSLIGDDLLVTNPTRLQMAVDNSWCNGALIKLNQIGTLLETAESIMIAKDNGWKVAISHRSGETEDNFIADLAYSCAADFLKSGSMSRSERLAKYNRLLEIESLQINES